MKKIRTTGELKIVSILKEMEQDMRIVKSKSDAKSHRNKILLKRKINIVSAFLSSLHNSNNSNKLYSLTVDNQKFFNKIYSIYKKEEDKKYFIKISVKDIYKKRLNSFTLKKILKVLNDSTWETEDYEDSISKVVDGKSIGIAFFSKKDYSKITDFKFYFSGRSLHGEYVDVTENNKEFFLSNSFEVISLKKFIKKFNL